jgi:hypothetical protein
MGKKFGLIIKIAYLIPFHHNMNKFSSKYDYIFETRLVPKFCEKSMFFMVHMEKIQITKHFKYSASFRLFLGKFGQTSAADLYGAFTFLLGSFE